MRTDRQIDITKLIVAFRNLGTILKTFAIRLHILFMFCMIIEKEPPFFLVNNELTGFLNNTLSPYTPVCK
jgi:hypothetical protein